MKPARVTTGFTLIEVLLAMTMLTLVITTVYATWDVGLRGWKRSASMTDTFQRQRVVLAALAELTEGIVFSRSASGGFAVQGIYRDDPGDRISFVTSSDALLPARETALGGLRRVTISLERDDYQRPLLAISNQPVLTLADATEELNMRVLSADVQEFRVRYRHPTSGAWQNDWQEARLVPAAIEYTITFGGTSPQSVTSTVVRTVDVPIALAVSKGGGSGAPASAGGERGRLPPMPVRVREVPGEGGRP